MQRLRRALRYARACAFVASGASARARRRLDGTRAAVLMYHRVIPADEAARCAVEPGMYVTPSHFARHLDWLASSFRVLPLHEIVATIHGGADRAAVEALGGRSGATGRPPAKGNV